MWRAESTSRLEKGSSRRRSSGVGLEDTRAREWRAGACSWEYWPTGRVRLGVEADGAEGHLGGADAVAGAFFAVEGGEVVEIFDGGELVVEHGGVAHVGEAATDLLRCVAEDRDGASAGSDEAGEETKEGRFAGTVLTEDDGAGTGGEGDGDVAERGEGAVEARDGVELGGDGRRWHLFKYSAGNLVGVPAAGCATLWVWGPANSMCTR